MRKRTRKLLCCAAMSVAVPQAGGAYAADSGTDEPDDYPGGTVEEAVDLILAGEAGERGMGMTKMWPQITIPALSNDQINTVVAGNTLRANEAVAHFFDESGKVTGWQVEWNPLPESQWQRCPRVGVAGDEYYLRDDGTCFEMAVEEVNGTWKVSDNKLCTDITWSEKRQNDCFHLALVIDRVILFNSHGAPHKKQLRLAAGKAFDLVE